ncbi:MAG: T9SS type A sorting domain-containing protein [Crocinitomicaceae bacterium]
MKQTVLTSLALLCSFWVQSQIISQFDWDSNPVTTATVGPNATGISTSATSASGGATGNGLNPSAAGSPKLDVNMTIPGSPTFDVDGIDFSIDYHREESDAEFFTRGASLVIGCGNQFEVSYRVDDGAGGFLPVSSGNVYPIPNDDTYRTYRFYYLPATGEGFLTVDGVQVWTDDGPDNRNLYWVGAGNVVIGNRLDGSGNNDTHLDNMIIGSVTNSALPIELLNFEVSEVPQSHTALIEWRTTSETNSDYFEIQKSADGEYWQQIGELDAAGQSSGELYYSFVDDNPFIGVSYYRLKQVDFDGKFEIFAPERLNTKMAEGEQAELTVFPNPAYETVSILNSFMNTTGQPATIYNLTGQKMPIVIDTGGSSPLQTYSVSSYPPGTYFISIGAKTVSFIKQ